MTRKKVSQKPATPVPVLDRQARPLATDELPDDPDLPDELPPGAGPIEWVEPAELVERYPEPEEPSDEPLTGRYPSGVPPVLGELPDTPAPRPVHVIGERSDHGLLWQLDGTWTERVERMAAIAGVPPQSFLEGLLRRAWVGLDRQQRGRQP